LHGRAAVHEMALWGGAVARIAVVDGEPAVGSLIALVLRGVGHEVVEVTLGEELLALLRREQPDAAVIDAELPGMGGVEVALTLARDPATAGIAVVLTSGVGDVTRRRAETIGAAFVPKPFAPAELRARVAVALARRGAATRPI
jgi:DNA-binding response OmpR family regulator